MFNNRVFQNAKWIIGCKIVQSLLQLIVGMLSARYLGPSNYGLISYAASIVAFVVPITQLGMSTTLVQEYVADPEKEGEILGTGLVMNLVSGAACIVAVVSFALASSGENKTTVVVCALYSLQLIFQTMELVQRWFQAKLLSKYSSLAMLGAYIAVSAYKIFLLATQKSVYWFALSHSVEYCVIGVAMLIMYKKIGTQRISFSMKRAKALFSRSKYYILANMMVTIFQNIDHVMLKLMMGDAENGFYTTAITCAGITGFVFTAIIDSFRPTALASRQKSREAFEKSMSGIYAAIIYLTLAQSICFTLLAKPIVWILYGESYLAAVPVLQIITWNLSFSYIGSVRNIWILAEEKHNLLWVINLCGVGVNIVLNALMIPFWGACGAAFASVLTQFFTNFVVGFLIKSIRPNNRLLVQGMNPKNLLEVMRKLWERR